jgi:hypothetical protein
MINPFRVGDRAYCIHSREWGEILEFRPGDWVKNSLEESDQSIRLKMLGGNGRPTSGRSGVTGWLWCGMQ